MYYQFNFINMIIITQLLYMVAYLYHKHVMFIHISLLLIPRIMIYDNSAKPQWLLIKTIYTYILLLPCSGIMHMYIHLYICMCMYACIYVCTYLYMCIVHSYICTFHEVYYIAIITSLWTVQYNPTKIC